MPIKKRTNWPSPFVPTSKKSDPYRLPGRPLEELVRECDKLASDAAWSGDDMEAARFTEMANRYRDRIAAGELYDVNF